jgi:hypothetical protein
MSSQDEKRPQRILSPSQVDTPEPVRPAPPAQLGERFRRMMQTPARRTDGSAGPSSPQGIVGGKVLFANLNSLLASASITKTNARGKEDDESTQPKNLRSNEASTRRSNTESAQAPVAASSSSQWTKGEEHTDTMMQNQAHLNDRIQAKASLQHWPEELTKAITTLCHRAGDQFTSWRVCVDLDQETLPQSELWLEASPQRLSLRFKTLSPLSFRLIFAHRDRLALMLKERLGSSRDVDIEIT